MDSRNLLAVKTSDAIVPNPPISISKDPSLTRQVGNAKLKMCPAGLSYNE